MKLEEVIALEDLLERTRTGWVFERLIEDEVCESVQGQKSFFVKPPKPGKALPQSGYTANGYQDSSWGWKVQQTLKTVVRRRVRALVSKRADEPGAASS